MTTTDNWPRIVHDFSEVPRADVDEAIAEARAEVRAKQARKAEDAKIGAILSRRPLLAPRPRRVSPWVANAALWGVLLAGCLIAVVASHFVGGGL